jgi:hypothetical protein
VHQILLCVGALFSYGTENRIPIRFAANRTLIRTGNRKRVDGYGVCVRICVRIAIRFGSQFLPEPNLDPILNLTPFTMVCLHILSKNNQKFTCGTPLAADRTPNRTWNRTQNRTRVDGP